MRNTNCEKCIFADYHDSDEPCSVGIIEEIKDSKSLIVNDQKFYSISNYSCPLAFSLNVYEKYKEEIGSIDDLKKHLYLKSQPTYYMIIFLDHIDPSVIVQDILNLAVKPGFVSIITYQNNNTENIIKAFTLLDNNIQWKLHNILEDSDYQDSLNIVLDTNPNKNSYQFLWVNHGMSHDLWNDNIIDITKIVTVKQPVAHALYREPKNKDGLFISLKNYEEIRYHVNTDISLALEEIENPAIKYYA
jgi:hypothetical protein